jgi:hypothetical protein
MPFFSSIGFEGDGSDIGLHPFGSTRGRITVYQSGTDTRQVPAYELDGWNGRRVGVARENQVLWVDRGNIANKTRNDRGVLENWVIFGRDARR